MLETDSTVPLGDLVGYKTEPKGLTDALQPLETKNEELKDSAKCTDGHARPVFPELKGLNKDRNKHPQDSIYAEHLDYLTKDAPKLLKFKELIRRL